MSYDHHAQALEIQSRLRADGRAAEANEIETAIVGGATGTEILFRLRETISRLRRDKSLPKDVADQMRILIWEIDNTLNPSPFKKLFDLFRWTK